MLYRVGTVHKSEYRDRFRSRKRKNEIRYFGSKVSATRFWSRAHETKKKVVRVGNRGHVAEKEERNSGDGTKSTTR